MPLQDNHSFQPMAVHLQQLSAATLHLSAAILILEQAFLLLLKTPTVHLSKLPTLQIRPTAILHNKSLLNPTRLDVDSS